MTPLTNIIMQSWRVATMSCNCNIHGAWWRDENCSRRCI